MTHHNNYEEFKKLQELQLSQATSELLGIFNALDLNKAVVNDVHGKRINIDITAYGSKFEAIATFTKTRYDFKFRMTYFDEDLRPIFATDKDLIDLILFELTTKDCLDKTLVDQTRNDLSGKTLCDFLNQIDYFKE